jgi:hypothetical protein
MKKQCSTIMPGTYPHTIDANASATSLTTMCDRDNVEWDEEQEKYALAQVERHASSPVPEEMRGK